MKVRFVASATEELFSQETCIMCYILAFPKLIWSEKIHFPLVPMDKWSKELGFINIFGLWNMFGSGYSIKYSDMDVETKRGISMKSI